MIINPTPQNKDYKPHIYNIQNVNDKKELSDLISSNISLEIIDEIHSQLEELIKLKSPKKKYTQDELSLAIENHLNGQPVNDYGNWVHYPWINKLVHILDESEFIEVRTNRNHYKITPDEEKILAQKKIGIIGLSVGKAIAMTMAMERICAELVLADFDVIELSNLNRIQTGVYNFGVKKSIVVAREIAEIDPYLRTTCYDEGLTDENIHDFFTKGGNLDLCVEVCDGLSTKISAREKAKELSIPVIMDTSDRGLIDVERFDLEPERQIFHGLIEHLNLVDLKNAKTNEEKIPFILPIVGINDISKRLKASMMEVQESISTWPQLASEVIMGGGVTTGVSRKILLNQFRSSGRYYLDIDDIFNDDVQKLEKNNLDKFYHPSPPLTKEGMSTTLNHYLNSTDKSNISLLSKIEVEDLVEAGSSAPSGGNCQPWKWYYKDGVLGMFYDKSFNRSFLDYNHISAHLSLGSALQNVVLKAHEMKLRVKTHILDQTNEDLITAFTFFTNPHLIDDLEPLTNIDLSKSILKRHTNRTIDIRQKINPKIYQDFEKLTNDISGIKLHICDDIGELNKLEDVIGSADRLRLVHPTGFHDLFVNELRLDSKEAEEKRDGVDIRTVDLNIAEITAINMAKDAKAIAYLQEWNLGTGFEKISRKAVKSSSAIGLITIPNYEKRNCLDAGRIIQNIWLKATELNIGLHPLCVPIMFFARSTAGNGEGLSQKINEEVKSIRSQFLDVFPIEDHRKEIFMFRLCIAETPQIKSLRRPIDKTLNFG